jgi:hypothetical protein
MSPTTPSGSLEAERSNGRLCRLAMMSCSKSAAGREIAVERFLFPDFAWRLLALCFTFLAEVILIHLLLDARSVTCVRLEEERGFSGIWR